MLITVKLEGKAGSGKSKLARKIYEIAALMGLTIRITASNDGGKTWIVESDD